MNLTPYMIGNLNTRSQQITEIMLCHSSCHRPKKNKKKETTIKFKSITEQYTKVTLEIILPP
jgi:hypothetical protein